MSKSQKQLQVAEQIRRNIAEIFADDHNLSIPGVHFTITKADVSPDVKNAKVFVNIFGTIDKAKLIAQINKSSAYFRGRLSKVMQIRHTPELLFILDDAADQANKINKLIEEEKKKFDI